MKTLARFLSAVCNYQEFFIFDISLLTCRSSLSKWFFYMSVPFLDSLSCPLFYTYTPLRTYTKFSRSPLPPPHQLAIESWWGEGGYQVVRPWGGMILTIQTIFKAQSSLLWILKINENQDSECLSVQQFWN